MCSTKTKQKHVIHKSQQENCDSQLQQMAVLGFWAKTKLVKHDHSASPKGPTHGVTS